MSNFNLGLAVGVVVSVAAFGAAIWYRTSKTGKAIDELVEGFDAIRKDYDTFQRPLKTVQQRYETLLSEIKAKVRTTAIDPEEMEMWLDRIAESHRSILVSMSKSRS